MSLTWTFQSEAAANHAAAYALFKTALAQTGFRGDIFTEDAVGTTDSVFTATAVDYVRSYVHLLHLEAGVSGSQKPASFDTDFPAAIAITDSGVIFSVVAG